ncbi:TetR/AcrR family transcriptional regulator [Kitasatospora sp. NPDC094011]|uniref:TetR/AcrR family transcriptional regulator n=1 Tax=Kitasatospora sp. NPDC094011 TaxID=3364090 RepID=UPI0037F89A7E
MGNEGSPAPAAGESGTPSPSGRARLSRPRVLRTAVALVDREGLAALTMRTLAAELGVEPMALYRYTSGKEALLDGLVEAFYAEVNDRLHAEPGPVRPDRGLAWRAELHRIADVFQQVADAHPRLFPLVVTRPLTVPLARRSAPMLQLNERLLALFGRAGFDDRTALRIYRTVVGWVLGYLVVDKRQMVDNPDEPEPMLRLGLHRLPVTEYPRLRALASLMADHDPEEELRAGLDILLDRVERDGIPG